MNREIPVRFCERLRVKFPRPTHPNTGPYPILDLLFVLRSYSGTWVIVTLKFVLREL